MNKTGAAVVQSSCQRFEAKVEVRDLGSKQFRGCKNNEG